jgi:hypothetical protein
MQRRGSALAAGSRSQQVSDPLLALSGVVVRSHVVEAVPIKLKDARGR